MKKKKIKGLHRYVKVHRGRKGVLVRWWKVPARARALLSPTVREVETPEVSDNETSSPLTDGSFPP